MIPFASAAKVTGGHAFALVGYTDKGFVVQNSWGVGWGWSGFAILSYADWVANGSDAWTVSLGVPIVVSKSGTALRSPTAFAAASGGLNVALVGGSGALASPPTDKPYWQPHDEAAARKRMVVMGNNGLAVNRLVECAHAEQAVAQVTRHLALDFFARHPQAGGGAVKRVVLYAHGGLNSEEQSLARTRILAPYFEANGVYPIFITWKSGAGEIIKNILEDRAKEVGEEMPYAAGALDRLKEAAREVWDRAIEVLAQTVGVKSIWSEMKQNAMLGAQPGNALALMAQELAQLRLALAGNGQRLELHLVGHSAGAIVLGHLLDLFSAAATHQNLASCSLYAPACTVAFANRQYLPAVLVAKILPRAQFHMSVLSDRREQDDRVGPYQKSLLYLVSRALEDLHKTPILGLLKSFDPACNSDEHWNEPRLAQLGPELQRWQQFWWGNAVPSNFFKDGSGVGSATFDVVDHGELATGARTVVPSHGTFDNDLHVIRATLGRIIGPGLALVPSSEHWNLDY